MNMKSLVTASIFALLSTSVAQAADVPDVVFPQQQASSFPSVFSSSSFSWTGFYVGAQGGTFSGRADYTPVGFELPQNERKAKLSGFVGGLYAGSNIDFGGGLVLGVDADVILTKKGVKETKDALSSALRGSAGNPAPAAAAAGSGNRYVTLTALEKKWGGAVRARVGFSIDRVMPYISGGLAYARMQQSFKVSSTNTNNTGPVSEETKGMVGYVLGGGIDFAVTDAIVARAEYRHSAFGKANFIKENPERKIETRYKSNDFRVGVAYKF